MAPQKESVNVLPIALTAKDVLLKFHLKIKKQIEMS